MKRDAIQRAAALVVQVAWVAACRLSAATDSLDSWQPLNPTPTANRLNAVIYGDDRYVAVGELGTLVTSTNAANWTLQASANVTGTLIFQDTQGEPGTACCFYRVVSR
jgi:hypothetical protein